MSKSPGLMGLGPGRPSASKKAATLSSLQRKAPTVRVNFDLPSDQHMELKLYSAATGVSISDLLRDLVSKVLKSDLRITVEPMRSERDSSTQDPVAK